ncbi:MAG: hypothetical protein ACOH2E_03000 [Candidatus Paracaedibacter sp.]
MQVKNPIKLTTVLLASTVMVGSMVLPEAACGSGIARQRMAEAAERERLLALAGHAHVATIADVRKHKDALKDPNAALTAAGPADLTAILTTAAAAAGSAIHAHALATHENKLDALTLLEAAAAPAIPLAPTAAETADETGKSGIRTALGLDPTPAAFPGTTAEVTAFISAAKERLVRLPDKTAKAGARKATIAGHAVAIADVRKHKDALKDPNAALTAAGPADLTAILTTAAAAAGSAIHAHALATHENKLDALTLLEAAAAPAIPLAPTAAETADETGKSGIRTALGLDPTPAAFPGTTAEVTAFISAAKERLVRLPDKTAKAGARKATIAGHAVAIADVRKHKDALKDPNAALTAAGPADLTAILTTAAAAAGSAIHAHALATHENKLDALTLLEAAAAPAIPLAPTAAETADETGKSGIRTALGLDPTPAAFPGTTAEVTAFISAAKERLVRLPDKTAKAGARKATIATHVATIAELQKYADAIAIPHAALGGGRPLQLAIAHEVGVGGSTAHAMPIGTPEQMAAVVRAIEMALVHQGGLGGNALDDAAKSAIRTALGIDPTATAVSFATTRVQVLAFLVVAEAPEIHNMLAGVGALADPTLLKLDTVRRKLLTGTHNALTGAGVAASGANDSIHISLGRLGMP